MSKLQIEMKKSVGQRGACPDREQSQFKILSLADRKY